MRKSNKKGFTVVELVIVIAIIAILAAVLIPTFASLIQKANEFKSSIWIEKEERRVNAKSLLGVLSLGIDGGTTIKVIADGSDEQAAVNALVDLVDSGFSDENR